MVKLTQIINNCFNYPIENNYFTQFNINLNYTLCPNFLNTHIVDSTCSTVKILNTKFINTPIGKSIEGQSLTGKKLSLIGVVYVNIIFTNIYTRRNCVVKVPVNFSTFIIVPDEICTEDTINLSYLVEDISLVRITRSKILISVTLIFNYEDYH